MRYARLSLLVLVAAITLQTHAAASAAEPVLQVGPTKFTLSMNAGETKTVDVTVQNTASSAQDVQVIFTDAVLDDAGKPQILPIGQRNDKDGVSAYVSGATSFSVAASVRYTYKATITIPQNTDSKTRYGTLTFRTPDDATGASTLLTVTTTAASSQPATSASQPSSSTNIDAPDATAAPTATNSTAENANVASDTAKTSQASATPSWYIPAAVVTLLIAAAGSALYITRRRTNPRPVVSQPPSATNTPEVHSPSDNHL